MVKKNSLFIKTIIVPLVAALLCASPAVAKSKKKENIQTIQTGNGVVTELWDGKVLTATFRAGMCFEPSGNTKGVLLLRHSSGKEDVYHLYGKTSRNKFSLSHGSGHEFTGEFNGPDQMKGKVKLANGLRLSLNGKRHKDVPLAAEDCAPLPE